MVIASDGVWGPVTDGEAWLRSGPGLRNGQVAGDGACQRCQAVRIVASVLREGGEENPDRRVQCLHSRLTSDRLSKEPAANAARVLLEIAHQRDGHDVGAQLLYSFAC